VLASSEFLCALLALPDLHCGLLTDTIVNKGRVCWPAGSLSRIAPELNEDRYKAWLNEARSRLEADLKQMAGGSSSSSGSVGGLAFCQDRIKDVDAGLKFYADRRPYVHLADSYTAPMLLLQVWAGV